MADEKQDMFGPHLAIIDALLADVKENPSTSVNETPTLDFFWIKICLGVQCISKSATNLCMAYSQPDVPASQKEADPLLRKLENDAVALVSAFYALSPSHGMTLKKVVHECVVSIVRAVKTLIGALQTLNPSSAKDQLQKTGTVWECCDAFPNLPRDNPTAVLRLTLQTHSLVTDAIAEFEDAQRESSEDGGGLWDDLMEEDGSGDGGPPAWSDADKLLHGPVLGLVKTTKACLKKTSVTVKSVCAPPPPGCIPSLDAVREHVDKLSPAVDDLMTRMYPPAEDGPTIKQHAHDLHKALKTLLDCLRECKDTLNTDDTWIDFLTKAADHNYQKLTQIVAGD